MARLSPREAAIHLRSRFTGEARRRDLAMVARQAIAEVDARNARAVGAPLGHTVFVDGREGAALESVRPGGVIVALWAAHYAAIDFAYETLLRLSPVLTGRYRASHVLLLNGDPAPPPPIPIRPDDVVTFVNVQPYARRIERGSSPEAPDGVYEATSEIVKARFGNVVSVRFGYQRFAGAQRSDASPAITIGPRRRR